jgi:hypothetical protein
MVATERIIGELDDLLRAMPPGGIDMDQTSEIERRRGRRFFEDPPEIVHRYLLDQQRRLQRSPDST